MNFVVGYLQYDGRRSRFPSYIYYTIFGYWSKYPRNWNRLEKQTGSTYHFKRVSTCDPYDSFIIFEMFVYTFVQFILISNDRKK